MKRYRAIHCVGLLLGLAVSTFAARPACAIGYWNLPGNFCQCFGYGWGPGYHAPMVLGPPSSEGLFAHNTVRLPAAPSPPYSWSPIQPSFAQPSLLPPVPLPAGAPAPAAFRGPVFR